MQTIEIAVGDPVDAGTIQNILTSLVDPGILSGFELTSTSSDTLAINPGTALVDSGILIVEDEQQTKPFTLSVNPANYTVYYSYVPTNNFGGNPAQLIVQPGLIDSVGFTNGVILGWIIYPGGSVPLNANTMFLSGPRLRLSRDPAKLKGSFDMLYSPVSTVWTQLSLTGAAPTILEGYNPTYLAPVTTLTNTSSALLSVTYLVPFTVPADGLGQISAQVQVDAGAVATFSVVDQNGNEIDTSAFNFFTNSPMAQQILSIPYGVGLVANSQMFVKCAFEIQPQNSIRLKSIGVSAYTDPF